MLILLAHNDGTGTNESANYDIEVRVNADTIWRGHVEGHNRADGWPALLRQLAEQAQAEPRSAPCWYGTSRVRGETNRRGKANGA